MEKTFIILSELVLGYLLQSMACIIWLSAFYEKDISAKRFAFYSAAVTIVVLLARALPLTFGIHTILSIISIILIAIWELKMDIYRSVIIACLAFAIIMACEIFVFLSMRYIFFGAEVSEMFLTTKIFHNKTPGIMANVIYFFVVSICYVILKTSGKGKDAFMRAGRDGKVKS